MKNFVQFVTPSWLSSLIGVTVGVLLTAGTIILEHYQGSQLRQEIFEVNSRAAQQSSQTAYGTVTSNIAHNHVFGVAPLFIIWAAIGLGVYYITITIFNALQQASAVREQLDYVNSSRQAVLRQAFLRLGIRVAALVLWVVVIISTLRVAVPYALALAGIASQGYSVSNALYALGAVAALFVALHLNALCMRLIVLRPRLFRG